MEITDEVRWAICNIIEGTSNTRHFMALLDEFGGDYCSALFPILNDMNRNSEDYIKVFNRIKNRRAVSG